MTALLISYIEIVLDIFKKNCKIKIILSSHLIISIVIICVAVNLWRAVIGAVVLVALSELLLFISLPNSIAANVRQMHYGSLLIIFIMWRPRGIIGEYSFHKK